MKYFRMSYEEVVFKRSYLNILLLNRSIPSLGIDTHDNEDKSENGRKNASTQKIDGNFRNENDLFMSLM